MAAGLPLQFLKLKSAIQQTLEIGTKVKQCLVKRMSSFAEMLCLAELLILLVQMHLRCNSFFFLYSCKRNYVVMFPNYSYWLFVKLPLISTEILKTF